MPVGSTTLVLTRVVLADPDPFHWTLPPHDIMSWCHSVVYLTDLYLNDVQSFSAKMLNSFCVSHPSYTPCPS